MKRTSSILTTLVILSLLLSTSCTVEEVYLVELEDVVVQKVEQDRIVLDVNAILDNPNSFNIHVNDSDLDLTLAGVKIGKTRLADDLTLKKQSQASYAMEIIAEGENMSQRLIPVFLTTALTGKVDVQLNGTISGKVLFFSRDVKVNIREEVSFKNES